MLISKKVSGYQLFTGIRGHGVDTRKVCYKGIALSADHTVFPVYGNAREVTYMLVGTGKLVKQCGLAAILVSCKGKGKQLCIRQWIFRCFNMVFSAFTKAWMRRGLLNGA